VNTNSKASWPRPVWCKYKCNTLPWWVAHKISQIS